MKFLILTHGGCMDGVCAAAVARKWARARPGVETIEVRQLDYGAPFDVRDVEGKHVVVTDFALPESVMADIALRAEGFIWIDHHATNQSLALWMIDNGYAGVYFDLERSGAGLAWDVLVKDEPRPWFVSYIEDRDLWRWALPDSYEVSLWTQAQPKDVDAYERCFAASLVEAAAAGRAMKQFVDGWVRDTVACARPTRFEGLDCLLVTMTYSGSSDVLNALVKHSPSGVAMGWFQRADGQFQTSLRSDGRVDVSVLAKKYGGGGHPRAAAFQGRELFPWEASSSPAA